MSTKRKLTASEYGVFYNTTDVNSSKVNVTHTHTHKSRACTVVDYTTQKKNEEMQCPHFDLGFFWIKKKPKSYFGVIGAI